MVNDDPYYKKTVEYDFYNHHFKFMVSQELFSSQVIDHGTQRLLRSLLFEKVNSFNKALDLGCGYGPIGIGLKKICPHAEIHMIDRDALALVYAKLNAELNKVNTNILTYGSLGYDSVKDSDFDLIVSNIPAKVGERVLKHILEDARFYLNKNGKVAIVVIDAIADYVHQVLINNESIEIIYHQFWPGHHVYHYQFKSDLNAANTMIKDAFERGDYSRLNNQFRFKGKVFTIQTTFHVPEFDQLNYDSELLLTCIDNINNDLKTILVFNPGQGYVPVALAFALNPAQLLLVDRDLQALKTSRFNLIANNYADEKIALYHQIGINLITKKIDLIVGILPEQQNLDVYKLYITQASNELKLNGLLIFSSSSTVITRIEKLIPKTSHFKFLKREKRKGRSVIILVKVSNHDK